MEISSGAGAEDEGNDLTGRITPLDIYKVQADRISNMNTSLYRIPPIFSTIIGGLWYFASTAFGTPATRLRGLHIRRGCRPGRRGRRV